MVFGRKKMDSLTGIAENDLYYQPDKIKMLDCLTGQGS
jgi:hypothetical protein